MIKFSPPTLLAEKLPSVPTVVMERTLAHDIDALVADALPPGKLAVVDDFDASEAFGNRVAKALKGALHVTLPTPEADDATADDLRRQVQDASAIIAVGSGTISDLCKYVSYQAGKPYAIFPTAASMNGYCSANASIAIDGYKKTMQAHMPRAVWCDMSVIAAAPSRLSKAGLGDSLARPTAQADWLLSHLLLGTVYDASVFTLTVPDEPELFSQARGIALGDEDSIALLMKTLILSGLGMTIAGGSYPASQGEHMIAHAYNMLLPKKKMDVFHGEEIGVTALAMARRQEALLGIEPELLTDNFKKENLARLYGDHVANEAEKAFAEKRELINGSLRKNAMKDWAPIAAKLEKVMMPPARIEAILNEAEAPVRHQQLGWEDGNYMTASTTARYLRERFTFLDLC